MALLKDGTRIYGNATVDGTLTTSNITLTSGIDTSYVLHEPNSSGDGNGYSTLQLIPDGNLISGGQYLIVDPTGGGHIHIRAGGLQDFSPGVLIIGGEHSNFTVNSGANPPVSITSNSHVWTFSTTGGMQWPDGYTQDVPYRVARSDWNVSTPSATYDNMQIGINLGWQPWVTCYTGQANVSLSCSSIVVGGGNPVPVTGNLFVTAGGYGYPTPAVQFAQQNDSMNGILTDNDAGRVYQVTWYAGDTNPKGYVSIQPL